MLKLAGEESCVDVESAGAGRSLRKADVATAVSVYALTTVLVILGLILGLHLFSPSPGEPSPLRVPGSGNACIDALTLWDGQWYLKTAQEGYDYDPNDESSVAFFPLYPLLVGLLYWASPLSAHMAGLIVSHAFLIAAYVLFIVYAGKRVGEGRRRLVLYALAALALFPTSLFMRMAYAESAFLFLCLLAFWGMERHWPLWVLALIVGLVTATRPPGLMLVFPLALVIWERSCSWRQAVFRAIVLGPAAVWGLAAFVVFQWWTFDEPLAFIQVQHHWRMRAPAEAVEVALALASWEPIWSVFSPSRPGYWATLDPGVPALFSFQAANVVLFVLAAALVFVGTATGWLTGREAVFAAALLAFTYIASGHRFCMASQGRFASVVFPMYLVMGHLLYRLPSVVSAAVLGTCGFYLAVFAGMLAAGYLII